MIVYEKVELNLLMHNAANYTEDSEILRLLHFLLDISTEVCTCTNTTILSVVLTAILTALLATVIFVVVQVVVCKRQLKSKPGGGVSEGEQVYEQMGRDEGGVAMRGGTDPMYMEVGERKGHTFQLKENEAYGTHS